MDSTIIRTFFITLWAFVLPLNSETSVAASSTSRSEYYSELNQALRESSIQQDGRLILKLKAVEFSEKLDAILEKVSPGFGHKRRSVNGQNIWPVIIAIQQNGRQLLELDELFFYRGHERAIKVKEILSTNKIEFLYPFAYPFYRVFEVEFVSDTGPLRVLSPMGEISLALNGERL